MHKTSKLYKASHLRQIVWTGKLGTQVTIMKQESDSSVTIETHAVAPARGREAGSRANGYDSLLICALATGVR